MGCRIRPGLWTLALVVLMVGCSKKKDAGDETAGKETPPGQTATGTQPLTPANAPFAPVITGKGYTVVQAKRFPAQVDARRASVIVYRSSDNTRGGVLYVRGYQDDPPSPVWHWYFADGAPDSIAAADINRDGLWDARVHMAGGSTREFIQDTDFTLRGKERTSLAAMNGASSSPEGVWKAFDADTATAWTSPAAGAYLEIPNLFGVEKGQLSVRLAGGSRPDKLEIGDGTRTIQECELAATAEEQRFQLDLAVKDLAIVRLNVVGKGKSVALSELELQ